MTPEDPVTEPRPWSTCTKNLVKLGRVDHEICSRTDPTDRQTDRHTHSSQYSTPPPRRSSK